MEASEQSGEVSLAPVLDLGAAAPLAAELLARRGGALRLDASGVERIGGQCLQALLSAAKTWKADAVPFRIVCASDAFTEGLRRLGVAPAELTVEETAPATGETPEHSMLEKATL